MAENSRAVTLRRALEAGATGEVGDLSELFTDDVSGWGPHMLVSSLDELRETLAAREDALSDVNIEIDSLDVFGNKGFVEYRINAVFSGPFVLDEETTIEPTGDKILIGAALVAEFSEDDKISAFRNYFDDAALLEQMVVA